MAATHHEYIEKGLERGLTAQRIWQDLVEQHGYSHGYLTVQRYARRLKRRHPELADHMEHPAGDEAQIDFFKSRAPIRDARTERRTVKRHEDSPSSDWEIPHPTAST